MIATGGLIEDHIISALANRAKEFFSARGRAEFPRELQMIEMIHSMPQLLQREREHDVHALDGIGLPIIRTADGAKNSHLVQLSGKNMASKMKQLGRSAIRGRQSAERDQQRFNRLELVFTHRTAGVSLGYSTHTADFLGQVFEIVSVLLEFQDFKAKFRQMLVVKIPAESRGKMVRGHVSQTAKRSCQDQMSTRANQSAHFAQRRHRIWHMLEHLGTHHHVESAVRLGNRNDIADDVSPAGIPDSEVKPSAFSRARAGVLREILAHVAQMITESAELLFAGAGVKNACPRRNFCQCGFQPGDPIGLVGFADVRFFGSG